MSKPHPLDGLQEIRKLFPPIDQRLLDALELVFPHFHPDPKRHTERDVFYAAGQQRVVQYLRDVKQWQESDV